jgi:hypothetical protein
VEEIASDSDRVGLNVGFAQGAQGLVAIRLSLTDCSGEARRPPPAMLAFERMSSPRPSGRGVSKRLWCSRADRHGLAGGDYSITSSVMENMSGGISMRPEPPGVQKFEVTLAFLAGNGLVAHRGLPGHDGHEDGSLPEVFNPYGIS